MENQYKILGKLPNPLIFDDGSKVTSIGDWELRRNEFRDKVIELEFGGMPPEPEVFEIEALHFGGPGLKRTFRIYTGTKERQLSFTLSVYRPIVEGKRPVLLTGDGCYDNLNDEVIAEALNRGFAIAIFNRTELAPDMYNTDRNSGIYKIYPDMHFSAISSWAWGYKRAVDALLTIDYVDPDAIAITGHSRGGKTVLLAGAVDDRIKYINPNNSGAHGCGCYRFEQYEETGEDTRSEKLEDLIKAVPYWLGPEMRQYIGREAELPHDMHYFKVLCAPRFLLETTAYGDTWSNPKGAYQTFLAAQKVYELLGAKDNIAVHYREGGHRHGFDDFCVFMDLIECKQSGKELPEKFTRNPYPDMEFMGVEGE